MRKQAWSVPWQPLLQLQELHGAPGRQSWEGRVAPVQDSHATRHPALESRGPLGRDTATHQGPTWLLWSPAVAWGHVSSSQAGLCCPGAQRRARWPCPLPCRRWHRVSHTPVPVHARQPPAASTEPALIRSWHSSQRAKENLLLSRASRLCHPPSALPCPPTLALGCLAGNQAGTSGSTG